MKAAILVKQKSPLVVDEVQIPEVLHYGQVLVKVHYSGLCGSQINEIEGVKGPDRFLPHLLGHEGSGVVEGVGPGVTNVKEGDHVVLHWRKGKGVESSTPVYKLGGRTVNAGWVTTFNESAVVSENRITPIPKSFDMKLASLYGCAVTTGFGVVQNDAGVKSGESLVVFGAGGTGTSIILASSLASAYPVIAVDINDFKLENARRFGATHVINSSREDARQKISEYLSSDADVAVDTTGIKEIRELAYEVSGREGRTILVGVPKAGEKMCIDSFKLHFKKKITGSHGGDSNPAYDIPRLLRLQESGRFSLEKMVTKVCSLGEINAAIQELREGRVIRCVIKMC
ncbi:zinc-binding dehydrogenase [Candidatus Woesearchaeota archaeon]|nr:zinc-binding dehydrogenase [Candidatus Woesearchaeota archaeon]